MNRRREPDALETVTPTIKMTSIRWTNTEIALFKSGVDMFGWGKWTRIAEEIGSISAKQVLKFSKSTL